MIKKGIPTLLAYVLVVLLLPLCCNILFAQSIENQGSVDNVYLPDSAECFLGVEKEPVTDDSTYALIDGFLLDCLNGEENTGNVKANILNGKMRRKLSNLPPGNARRRMLRMQERKMEMDFAIKGWHKDVENCFPPINPQVKNTIPRVTDSFPLLIESELREEQR